MSDKPVIRHQPSDRLMHWLFALCILLLLGSGILPKMGLNFAWLELHWVAGLVLILLTLIHLLRVLLVKPLSRMWIGSKDFSAAKPGKFTLAQKLLHNVITLIALIAMVTGALMMVRITTPLWERNPYWLAADTWGVVYVLHGLMALVFTSMIMLHLYFSLRPEKRLYLRSMCKGWITRKEYEEEHDPERWKL